MFTTKSMSMCALGLLGLGIGLVDVEAGESTKVCHDRMLHVVQAPRDEIFTCDEWQDQFLPGPLFWDCDKESDGWSEGGASTQWRLRDDYVKSGDSFPMPWFKGVRFEQIRDDGWGDNNSDCSNMKLFEHIMTCEHGAVWVAASGCPSSNHGGECDDIGVARCLPDPNPPTTTTTKPPQTTTTTQTTSTTTTTTTTTKPTTTAPQPTTTEGASGPHCDDLVLWDSGIHCKDLEDGSVEFTMSPGSLTLGESVAFVNGAHFVNKDSGDCTSELQPTERSSQEYCLKCDLFDTNPCSAEEDASLRGGKRE